DVRADPGQVGVQVGVAPRTGEQLPDDQQGPAVADGVEGARDGTVLAVASARWHATQSRHVVGLSKRPLGKTKEHEKPEGRMEFRQSSKLSEVCYEIRGPVIEHANALEEAGHSVLRLNTGNPALFGFEAPEEILQDMIRMLPQAHGYTDSRGILSARRAVAQRYQTLGLEVDVDDVFLGNGVSELVSMAVQALLEDGDEVLVPAPDFPLWTAVTNLAGGKAVHYLCDEQADWYPDLDDMAAKITDRTRAVVIINPNNPTGAVYPKEVVEGILDLARRHGLMVFADEIYDQILYDDAVHHSAAALAPDLVVLTFCGLSKTYRVAGFRSGWLVVTGPKQHAKDYLEGLTMLASMRLCANAPAQYAIQAALGGRQSIRDLTAPGGRLREQRDVAWEK